MCILLTYANAARVALGDGLLPPPGAVASDPLLAYRLTRVINHYDTGQTVPVTRLSGG